MPPSRRGAPHGGAARAHRAADLFGQLSDGQGPVHTGRSFLYDSTVAIILIGCGEVGRASRIGDAMLYALDHDRFWHDGRLRNGYPTGPVAGDPIKLAGWWDAAQSRWDEDSYQVGSDTGNMAWATMALLALDRAGAGPHYKDGAARVSAWIVAQADTRGAGGYTGGAYGWEPTPLQLLWKSTEHNTDIAAAFTLMAQASGDPVWTARASAAARLVQAMWDEGNAGVSIPGHDRKTARRATDFLVLDAVIWPLLALAGKIQSPDAAALSTAEARLRAHRGFTYSEAGRGFWTEGTAYVCAADAAARSRRRGDRFVRRGWNPSARLAAYGYFCNRDVQALATGSRRSSRSDLATLLLSYTASGRRSLGGIGRKRLRPLYRDAESCRVRASGFRNDPRVAAHQVDIGGRRSRRRR